MPTSKEEAKPKVAALVAEHKTLTPAQAKAYHEAKTKQGFVVPLFRSLGWDFDNVDEVAPEEKASKGRVDYAFKLRGVSRFYLEAKPLKADLNDPDYIKQAVTYAYNKGVTWAGLTSFDRLRLFNAQTGQAFLNLTCQDYVDDFDRLWLLSKESVEAGALDKEAAKVGALPAPQPVEKRLFALLRQWREELFAQLYHHNPHLSFAQIDEVILRLFNRLIFIRNAEDRGLEERVLRAAENQWESGGHKPELIEKLREVFRQFDGYYDSDLFRPHLVDQVFIEGDTLARITRGLYEVRGGLASYDFSVIDADVLGAVYEQYLGHVATVVKQRAKEAQTQLSLGFPAEEISLEAKRQKRKEQGIYYTPRWVTDYIVRQTVGRFISEHNHDEILNIKVLDPACGSGSFLIRAYDELLSYHARVRGKPVQELDQWDRLPILTRNIFGVDLDGQAVEIARLNLLLRSLARRETLPSLEDNIRQGNSLISGGEAELKPYFGDSWPEKRPFNYEQEFPDIMKAGGFDVVIGNPPYIRLHNMAIPERAWFFAKYKTAKNKCDVYGFFLERAVHLLKDQGILGFIIPDTWCSLDSFEPLRAYLLYHCRIVAVCTFADNPFPESTVSPVIVVLQKSADPNLTLQNMMKHVHLVRSAPDHTKSKQSLVPQSQILVSPHFIINLGWTEATQNLFDKLAAISDPLQDVALLYFGIKTGDDAKFIKTSKETDEDKPVLRGMDVHRYYLAWSGKYVWYSPEEMKRKPIARPGSRERFEANTKLILQGRSGRRIIAAYDDRQFYSLGTTSLIHARPGGVDLKFLLGILNSRLLNFWYGSQFITSTQSAGELSLLPIRRIDFSNPAEKKGHDDLVALVERMLALHQKLRDTAQEWFDERRELEREIKHTDAAIDALVYDLYGLTEEERKIVEASA